MYYKALIYKEIPNFGNEKVLIFGSSTNYNLCDIFYYSLSNDL